ncbi:MAG TPA: hypothetical protein VIY73_02800 [Polyangiaceae bacterium]
MASIDKMFRVIVAGGVALAAAAPAAVVGCGGSVATHDGDAGFPQEGPPPPYSPDAFPSETASFVDAFPQETGYAAEASAKDGAVVDAGTDAFPQEGPSTEAGFFDTGALDAGSGNETGADADAGFPFETAAP